MSREQSNNLSVEELVALARDPSQNTPIEVEKRSLKEVELFIQDLELQTGPKVIHNLVLYDIYRNWCNEQPLDLNQFNKTFCLYFQKTKDSSNNLAYKLKTKYKGGKFKTTQENIKRCRGLYGRQKKERETSKGEISEPQSQSQQD